MHPEVVEFNKGAKQFAPIALSKMQSFQGYEFFDFSDPGFSSARQTADSSISCKKEMREHGVFIKPGVSNWEKRLRAVNYFLTSSEEGEPGLTVDPRCEYLIGGFEGGYRFRTNAWDRRAEDVVKNEYSEVHDCLQHMCYFAYKQLTRKEIPIYNLPQESYSFGSNYNR